jgi:hypothetical protein
LQVSGSDVYSKSGQYIGQIRGDTVFGTDGTIVGDRVVYRGTESARMGSPSTRAGRAGSARANAAGSAVWGEEPDFPV